MDDLVFKSTFSFQHKMPLTSGCVFELQIFDKEGVSFSINEHSLKQEQHSFAFNYPLNPCTILRYNVSDYMKHLFRMENI